MTENTQYLSTELNADMSESEKRAKRDHRHDVWFRRTLQSSAMLVLVLLGCIALSTLWGGALAFQTFGFGFLTSTDWDVNAGKFGALVPIYGTLVTSFLALLIAVPVSFGIAIFLTEVAPPWLRMPIASAIELLAGIPSIIYGMWGLFVFGPFMAAHISPWITENLGALPLIGGLFQGPPLGIGMLTAGIVLAIMIIPFITSVMQEVFRTVPTTLKESAYALGSTTWEVVWDIVLPYTRSAVVGGVFLGLGRALGETMAVTFVLGNAIQFSGSLMMPSSSIASVIANEFNESYTDLHRSALIALGFLLFVVTFIVLALARLMLSRLSRKEGL
ncbi:phosphate ABC transporter permease subunit PstC [Pseudomonas syringae]|uniref:phosphate ABC transporter permease subunit PstC n=1 Tax=Pseudomonas TaxID=286 RepID=UPI00070304A7|nr:MULTISPECIES: phosphate ABC transporter permease subunit PstC [Pseudomonas]MBD8494328.1 phosphate ABC transporter permease subunit PstC [Pseudomonas syringae]KQQ56185.1 phosphate ABC transporter permease [Pseudomonas sp. Leaf127]MBD8576050.1 phosphate ABC transporter permease subunit PstC [Pseudomonas syringae]MBD8792432.1 phosphate ABC transporter permease subunit PstC [Pseudomonas syringae]MBD8802098.1 phosphate ABC transporter permease subunit PstC [Pseudomonas syringae]